jgi:hypothetical protein
MLLVLLLLSSFSLSFALKLDCTYTIVTWNLPGKLYTCGAAVVRSDSSKDVTGVSQNHSPGKNNDDVIGLLITNQAIDFFPGKISEFFQRFKFKDLKSKL